MTLEELHEMNAARLANITIGDIIHDGLAISRVTGEATIGTGKHPQAAWTVECIHPFRGQESIVLKDAVLDVMPRREP